MANTVLSSYLDHDFVAISPIGFPVRQTQTRYLVQTGGSAQQMHGQHKLLVNHSEIRLVKWVNPSWKAVCR